MMFLFICTLGIKSNAQVDPTLTGMISIYTQKAEDELKSQKRAMLLETTGHLWLKEEVEGTTDIQKKISLLL